MPHWSKMKNRPPKGLNPSPCNHDKHFPEVPSSTVLVAMSDAEVRRDYPRFDGVCEDCGQRVILYGSYTHLVAGDW